MLIEKNAITAGPFGTIFKAKDFRSEGIPIIQIRHITQDGFSWGKKTTFMAENVYNELHVPYRVKSGDLLLTKLGEPPGLACLYPETFPTAMVTPDVIKVSLDNDKINSYFVLNMYNSQNTNKRLLLLTKGGTRPRVTLPDFYALKIPFPPLKEQNKIANILASVDDEIRNEKNKLKQLTITKKGLMQDLLTGKVRVKI